MDKRGLQREKKILKRFTEIYCRAHHATNGRSLCPTCQGLVSYAYGRLEKCPYDPKPKCKDCPTHCYRPDYREQVKNIMRFSGKYFVKRGRLDWLLRYFI
jgi:hypothetical protein